MNVNKKLMGLLLALTASLSGWSIDITDYQVVPLPQQIVEQKGQPFVLNSTTPIVYTSDKDTPADISEAMERNAGFLQQYVREATGYEAELLSGKVKKRPAIQLTIDPKQTSTEGYRISVSVKGITISAATPQGVFYGIQTLRKSLPQQGKDCESNPADGVKMPAVEITDQPRFGYRGMHLDCARHFFTVDQVKTYIDMLALHNMNRFHWHLTDDQGWRIEIKKYPRLTEFGSVRTGTVIGLNSDVDDETPYGGFYTQEQIRDIISYAQERYIEVIPEIDMPGHMLAALASYPELGCTGGPYEVGHKWGVGYDVLCVGNPKTIQFAKDVLAEVAELFPSPYIHIGGDETPTVRWEACAKCKALGVPSVQGYFTHEIELFLAEKQKKVIGWDEILEHGVAPTTTIMSWRGVKPGYEAAGRGNDVIMSPTSHCYWDFCQVDDTTFEPSKVHEGYTVEKVYSLDPAPDSIPDAARQHILGVQANLWTEYVYTFRHAQYQVLPRMAALAEVQWLRPEQKDLEQFKQRAARLSHIYDRYDWTYAKYLWPERVTKDRWRF